MRVSSPVLKVIQQLLTSSSSSSCYFYPVAYPGILFGGGSTNSVEDRGQRERGSAPMLCLDYTGCPRRNVPDFGRVFLMLKYTDITQNTYVPSWTVIEIMAREKCDLLSGPCTVPVSWQPYPCPSLSVVSYYGNSAHAHSILLMYFLLGDKALHVSAWHSCHV